MSFLPFLMGLVKKSSSKFVLVLNFCVHNYSFVFISIPYFINVPDYHTISKPRCNPAVDPMH